jgi:ankyrin repeat protein
LDELREILDSIAESTEFLGIALNDVNQRGQFGNTPLKVAAVRGDLSAARALLDAGAEVNAMLENDFSALHHAAAHGHTTVIALLLERGAVATAVNSGGKTPIELARLLGEQAAVGVLEAHRGKQNE